MKTQLKADLMLVLVTLAWGVSYYVMDICLTELGPFTLNSFRFLGAFGAAALLSVPKLKGIHRTTLKFSALIGASLVFVYMGSTFGVKYTTISNSGLLCGMTVMFVPILGFVFLGKRPERKTLFAVAMSFLGIMLLTLKDDFSINAAHLKGDLFCLMCSVAYASDLLITERAVSRREVNAYQLGVLQLGVTGLFMTGLAFAFEEPHLPREPKVWIGVVFLAVFSTAVAFVVQTIAQQYTTAAHVGIIFTMEPVFASIAAFVLAGERLTPKSYLGAAVIVAALLLTEVNLKKKEEKTA